MPAINSAKNSPARRAPDTERFPVDFTIFDEYNGHQPKYAPSHSPASRWVVVTLGLALIVLAAIVVHDILVLFNASTGRQWLVSVYDGIVEFSIIDNAWAVAIIAGLIALFSLIWTVTPRKNTMAELAPITEPSMFGTDADGLKASFATGRRSALWLRPVDIARISTATARRIQGVGFAQSTATRGKLKVEITPVMDLDTVGTKKLKSNVAVAIKQAFAELGPAEHLEVKVLRRKIGKEGTVYESR